MKNQWLAGLFVLPWLGWVIQFQMAQQTRQTKVPWSPGTHVSQSDWPGFSPHKSQCWSLDKREAKAGKSQFSPLSPEKMKETVTSKHRALSTTDGMTTCSELINFFKLRWQRGCVHSASICWEWNPLAQVEKRAADCSANQIKLRHSFMTRRDVQARHHLILWLHSGQPQSATLKFSMQQYLPGRWPISFSAQLRTSSSCKEMTLSVARSPTPLNPTADSRPGVRMRLR